MTTRVISLTPRQRRVLHHLLHGELRKCSSAALESLTRLKWSAGAHGAYQLTELGRRLAEVSDLTPPDRPLDVLPEMLEEEPVGAGAGPSWAESRWSGASLR